MLPAVLRLSSVPYLVPGGPTACNVPAFLLQPQQPAALALAAATQVRAGAMLRLTSLPYVVPGS